MNIGTLNSKPAEVNGTKIKSLRYRSGIASKTAKEPSKGNTLLGSANLSMGVFSDDFAAVDLREELCYHSRPKKHKLGGLKRYHSKRIIIPKKSRAKNNPNFGYSPGFGLFWCGDPFEVKGELFNSSKVTVLLCPL